MMKIRTIDLLAAAIVAVAAVVATSQQPAFARKAMAYPYPVAYVISTGANDGWVLESSEFSSTGGSLNVGGSVLLVGDDASDRQFRSILHFNTGAALPDNAVVVKATLRLNLAGVTGTNPFKTHGSLLADIRTPFLGNSAGLEAFDFQAKPQMSQVGAFGSTQGGWYAAVLTQPSQVYISRLGTTQFRIYFSRGDNDDLGTDYLRFYSGNYATKGLRPVLEILYTVP